MCRQVCLPDKPATQADHLWLFQTFSSAPRLACRGSWFMAIRSADDIIRAAIAASIAEGMTYPVDALKTRLQLKKVTGSKTSLAGTYGSLYRGISPAIARHIPYTSIRITAFHALQEQLGTGFPATTVAGLLAGGLGQLVAAPLDLIKIRMIADARSSQTPRYTSLIDAAVKIVSREKFLGLWHGAGMAVQRAALVNLGELSTYSVVKQALLEHGREDVLSTHLTASLCSGAVSTLISNPADVVKSRKMNDSTATSSIRLLRDVYVESGWRGLYRGSIMTWARLGPWQLIFWVCFEKLRN